MPVIEQAKTHKTENRIRNMTRKQCSLNTPIYFKQHYSTPMVRHIPTEQPLTV